jgi:hypothetical protein
MNMRIGVITALLATTIPLSAAASQSSPTIRDLTRCRGNHSVVAECYALHGRMFLSNGSPSLRIWPVGTSRLLGVLLSEEEIIPSEIRKQLAFGVRIYADYEVCPFTTQKPGQMQFVCVESASNIVIEDLRQEDKDPKIKKLRGTYTVAPSNSLNADASGAAYLKR